MLKQRRRSAAQLISAVVFATRIVQFLYFLYTKFKASSHLLWLYSLVCVGPSRKPRRPVFSQRGSFRNFTADFIFPYVLQYVKQFLKSMIEDVFIQYHTMVHSVWHYYVQPKYKRPVSAHKVIGRF